MKITIKHNFPEVQRAIDALGKQARFATAVALTRTAQDVRAELKVEMKRVFDRPTRFTLNSLFLRPATKQRLEATVWVKDSERPTHYLRPQIEGGVRPQKRFEELLMQRGILKAGQVTVPGAGAKLDSSGNMSRAQIIQILSQLGAFNLAGSSQNATNSRRSRAKRAGTSYFYAIQGSIGFLRGGKLTSKRQHLPSGIYAKTGDRIVPVLRFVDSAGYKKRFDFLGVAKRVIARNFEAHFDREFANALRTARF